jgi:hypothetical protein
MDLEFKPFRPQVKFDNAYAYDIEENTIFVFENLNINRGGEKPYIHLEEEWMVTTLPHDYFHFLKEYFGSFLFYKKHVNPDIKTLVIDLNYKASGYHDTSKVNLNLFARFAKESKDIKYIEVTDFWQSNVLIDKLILLYDGSQAIINQTFPYFDQEKTGNVKVLREYMQELMKEDKTKPKKIFISRRLVSEYLERTNQKNHISRYNPEWMENATEDFFRNNGYEIIELSGMSLEDQISYFYNADYIAGAIGNGMINSIFAKPETQFTYLKIHKWFHYPYHNDASKVFDIKYNIVELYDLNDYEETINLLKEKTKNLNI